MPTESHAPSRGSRVAWFICVVLLIIGFVWIFGFVNLFRAGFKRRFGGLLARKERCAMGPREIKLWVSPKYTTDKLASGRVDDSIDVYEDRVKGWMLDHARALVDRPHSEYAVLSTVIGYFESHATYARGEDS